MGKPTPPAKTGALRRAGDALCLQWQRVIDQAVRTDDAGEPRRALALLAPLLAVPVPDAPTPALAARLHYAAGQCALSLADYALSDRHAGVALETALGAGDAALEAMVLSLRAQIRYHQGNYRECLALARRGVDVATRQAHYSLAAEAYLPQIMVHAGRGEFAQSRTCVDAGIALAARGDSALMRAQLFNAAGLHHYYEGLSRVLTPAMRMQVTLLDAESTSPARANFDLAETHLRRAIAIVESLGEPRFRDAMKANLYRVLVLTGKGAEAIPFLKRHILNTQKNALVSDEISARHTFAWALRSLGHLRESLSQVEAALALSRRAGRANRLVEALHFQRSALLAALGEHAAAWTAYQQYARLAARSVAPLAGNDAPRARLLEPFYIKRAEQILADEPLRTTIVGLAEACGVSIRTLQAGFQRFRGVTPAAHGRHVRLDRARVQLEQGGMNVAGAARANGFASATTFSSEFKRRFGVPPKSVMANAQKGA